jgi:hypothetical protein
MNQIATFSPASLQKNVTTAGTEVALASSTTQAYFVRIKAKHGNTNMIYVGANPVTSSTGYVLDAGNEIELPGIVDLSKIYIDADTNGEGVSVFYMTKD